MAQNHVDAINMAHTALGTIKQQQNKHHNGYEVHNLKNLNDKLMHKNMEHNDKLTQQMLQVAEVNQKIFLLKSKYE